MRWKGRRGSANIEDRRGRRGAGTTGRVGGAGALGLLAVLLIGWVFGVDVSPLLSGGGGGGAVESRPLSEAERAEGEFVSVVLADTEEIWTEIFRRQLGERYDPATLVLFSGVTSSPCGGASGATGPFYCPADRKAYLDTAYFTTLAQRFGATGDFAAAYVVAHEIAHHIQNELGILGQANALRAQSGQVQANAISVRIELQADCYAGIWARAAQARFGTLEPGDIAEAVNAAREIGDDRLEGAAGRPPRPHTYTHGTSEQRARWFMRGLRSGDLRDCDTFSATRL
ncbi:KPN_02809 family neutral zinc metallopeptidase [Jannaschia ovalis]|uniref:Neutral zinc metallopeptidase n=1 Tax=Jannaschia ovalis TaxID=3038773 RepID=A0ABY8LAX5_9RHOB|nr:neutral zinc metallopeptidase [Jannaschia sp. GRR-S6-38]WGH78490.1 neutral zinc metallopeptidase [Jannaschia sp. GRR-S6-38]